MLTNVCEDVDIGNNMENLKESKNRTSMWSSNPTNGYNEKNWNQYGEERSALPCSCQHYT
jgi:hypothetical protein